MLLKFIQIITFFLQISKIHQRPAPILRSLEINFIGEIFASLQRVSCNFSVILLSEENTIILIAVSPYGW
jgi:hypothetical protein